MGLGLQRFAPFFGRGLFPNEGEPWRRQRRLAQPAFHRQRIEGFVRLMTDSIAVMLDGWQRTAASGTSIDMAAEMARHDRDRGRRW
jgi:cytochrome P450